MVDEDLEQLHVLHEILALLNDAQAATVRLEPLCRALPPLERRLIALARRRLPVSSMVDVRRALAVVGNHGLEGVLLGLLEDLTVLKADRDDRQNGRATGPIRR